VHYQSGYTQSMLEITPYLHINESEIVFDFMATAVQLRFDVANSPSLPEEVKPRLIKLAGKRVTQAGVLIIEARRYRAQEANREEAIRRFSELVRRALRKPKLRKPTKPSQTAQEARLREKKHKGEIKRVRGKQSFEDE